MQANTTCRAKRESKLIKVIAVITFGGEKMSAGNQRLGLIRFSLAANEHLMMQMTKLL